MTFASPSFSDMAARAASAFAGSYFFIPIHSQFSHRELETLQDYAHDGHTEDASYHPYWPFSFDIFL